jgi:hypothetical protein
MFAKMLVSAAIAVGCCLGAAAPASAGPDAFEVDENVFGALTCGCWQTAPPGDSTLSEIDRGLRSAHSAGLTGPTTPIQHSWSLDSERPGRAAPVQDGTT